MRMLVTGSAGFIGHTLVCALKEHGHTVMGVDLKRDRAAHGSYEGDLRHEGCLTWLLSMPPVDCVVHLASDVGGFLKNADEHGQVDYECALLSVLDAYQKQIGQRPIIYTSSINVFERSHHYINEKLDEETQITPYARAKYVGEKFIETHFDSFAIVRPTNVFGRAQLCSEEVMGHSHVIPDLFKKIDAIMDDPHAALEVFGDGNQTRFFIHVNDVVSLIILLLERGSHSVDAPLRVWYNLRSSIHMSIRDVALTLMKLKGVHRGISTRSDYLRFEPWPVPFFDISPLAALGWKPNIDSLETGLQL